MARSKVSGPLVGNYVTFRLQLREAIAGVQVKRDALPFLPGGTIMSTPNAGTILSNGQMPFFRLSQICWYAIFSGGTLNVKPTMAGGAPTLDYVSNTSLTSGTPSIITPGAAGVNQLIRDWSAFTSTPPSRVEAAWTGGAGVAVPAGGALGWVTGYFTDHIQQSGPYAESGQSRMQGPVAGFYDNLSLVNCAQVANAAATEVCQITAPYAGRVMSVIVDARGLTTTTGSITLDITKGGSSILSATLDLDVNQQFVIDANSTPNLTADSGGVPPSTTPRTFAKGDALALKIGAGVADIVPVGACTAHLIVWCQGHVRDDNAEPLVDD